MMNVRPRSVAMATSTAGLPVSVPRVAHFGSCSVIRRVRYLVYVIGALDGWFLPDSSWGVLCGSVAWENVCHVCCWDGYRILF